jgi:1-hydroxycarotenoid 3,4-desaturase
VRAVPDARVIIVGAGIGGLAAAAGLAARGFAVDVFERSSGPGGKLRQAHIAGRNIDCGPTVLTMRWIFDEIFADAGRVLEDYLTLEPIEVLARHYWKDGATLDLFADQTRSADAIGRFAGAEAARGYVRFCARTQQMFKTLDAPFMRASEPSLFSLVYNIGVQNPAELFGVAPFASLWGELGKYFRDPRLRQLFGRYATYCGSSPFLAPATLMLIAHVERLGVWSVAGGMHSIAKALEAVAHEHGARFHYNSHVASIGYEGGRANSIVLADGRHVSADAIVFNGDSAALCQGLLGRAVDRAVSKTNKRDRSLSAVTMAAVADTQGFPLARHTVFFSEDSKAEFDDLTSHKRLPLDPTVYVCAQDRGGKDIAVMSGPERLFLIVNAPAGGDAGPMEKTEIDRCQTATFKTLARAGLSLTLGPATSEFTVPSDFEKRFPATGGALYGRASHGWRASFRRPHGVSRIPGLYLAGGSVHPGPGVPMAALSGRTVVSKIATDLASMRRLHPVATPGGMSMP